MEWRTPRFNQHGTIDIEIHHPEYGWLPFTAAGDDPEEHGRDLYQAVLAAGGIAPYEPPPPEPVPVPQEISRRQFYQGLALKEKITREEALAAIQTGAIPGAIQAIVDELEEDDARFNALMLLAGATDFSRANPLVLIFATAQSMSEADVDEFWRFCKAL